MLTSVEGARPRPLLDWCRLDRIANLERRDHERSGGGGGHLMIQDNPYMERRYHTDFSGFQLC